MHSLPPANPLVVIILDGWGISFIPEGNAILQASTPNLDKITQLYPTAALAAAGQEVGLPWGEVGNSETGHSNIGAGQIRYQALPRINKAISDGSFFENDILLDAIKHAKRNNSRLHLMGLLGPGGIHAHNDHLYALLELVRQYNWGDKTYIHLFTDGRDTLPQSAGEYIVALENVIGRTGGGKIASVTGRFFAMDRNENWERTKATYDVMTGGPRGQGASSAMQALENGYREGLTDDMIPPTAITRGGGPVGDVGTGDAIIFFNFRPDRARQLTRAFTEDKFFEFSRDKIEDVYFATMTEYDDDFDIPAAFTEEPIRMPLAKVISEQDLTQVHIAETEKYAHVTYYLNGGHENPFPGEKHDLIKSSAAKNFAEEPKMSAEKITNRVLEYLETGSFDTYFVNFANADMVGHTGDLEAGIIACEFVDSCIGRIMEKVLEINATMVITADHGNAEEMVNPQNQKIQTDHSSNPVPLHLIRSELARTTPRSEIEITNLLSNPIGVLADVAPTVLELLRMEKPSSMTGVSLINSLV